MIAKVDTACLSGIEAARVQVEVSLAKGMPAFSIVGLPDAAVREAKDRVVAAIRNSGFAFPSRRVTVNLAPAGLRKEGASFDLAIAIGILLAAELISPTRWPRCYWFGELALDGSLRGVRGMMPMAKSLFQQEERAFVIPVDNLAEVSCLAGLSLSPFRNLRAVVDWLMADQPSAAVVESVKWRAAEDEVLVDLADVKGQALAKRALEIAAAGRHNLLMIGSPGTGKSMLAQALPGILPGWTLPEALDATQIYSVAGAIKGEGLVGTRPFRNPHHSVTAVGLLGGGDIPMPGEISLAHRGVLFLDELPEFKRDALEALRQPLEQGIVHIQRVKGRASFPADFLLITAMNPCPCGYRGHPKRECECSDPRVQRYIGKISGPLLDRIDLHVQLPALKAEELFQKAGGAESSAVIKARVERARWVQQERYRALKRPVRDNARLSHKETARYCPLSSDGEMILKTAVDRLGLSARAFDRIRKVARTIADLESSAGIEAKHVAEAIQYRCLDRRNNF